MNNQKIKIELRESADKQEVTFIENQLPKLPAGKYQININQNTGGTGKGGSVEDKFEDRKEIYIGAERFRVNPEELYSMYPPKSYSGDVAKCLPNIVFSNPALPWQRSIGTTTKKDLRTTPWLALLMFYNDEPIPNIKDISLNDLGDNLPSDTLYPNLVLEPGQLPDNSCQIIDIDVAVFNQISPTVEDLQYLSHIKEVNVIHKAAKLDYDYHPKNGLSLNTVKPRQQFSVVICNRQPKPNTRCHMFLVSYENMGQYLPENDGTSNIKVSKSKVRLVVLENWEFYATQIQKNITDVIKNLNKTTKDKEGAPYSAPITLQLPLLAGASSDTEKKVNNAFSMGFVPLDHQMRMGGNTVSWQRSPFIPYQANKTLTISQTCSDYLIRYNEKDGMFDTTYASAWQLGKLLCIQDKGFAYQLYQWKRDKSKQKVDQVEQEALTESLLPKSSPKSKQSLLSESILNAIIEPMMNDYFREGSKKSGAIEKVREHRLQSLENLFLNPALRAASIDVNTDSTSQLIINWLSRLRLLYGVPYRYLIPHRELLPAESIKLFYIDPNFTLALIDGAYSIGRTLESDKSFDEATYKVLAPHINQKTLELRKELFNLPKETSSTSSVFSGFFLNSQLVSDFPGLEITAFDVDGNPLTILRMERVASEILLCIFNEEISSIQFTQPSEGLFFGLNGTTNRFYKTLRHQSSSDRAEIGKTDDDAKVETIPYRINSENVLNINDLAAAIKKELINNKLMNANDLFTSADFALQMTTEAESIVLIKK